MVSVDDSDDKDLSLNDQEVYSLVYGAQYASNPESREELINLLKRNQNAEYLGEVEWEGYKVNGIKVKIDAGQLEKWSSEPGVEYPETLYYYFDTETFTYRGVEEVRGQNSDIRILIEEEYLNKLENDDFDKSKCLPETESYSYKKLQENIEKQKEYLSLGDDEWALHDRVFRDETFMMLIKKVDWETLTIGEINKKINSAYCDDGLGRNCGIEFADESYYAMTRAEIIAITVEAGIAKEDYLGSAAEEINSKLKKIGYPPLLKSDSKPLDEVYEQ
jgi:hypothetical protein